MPPLFFWEYYAQKYEYYSVIFQNKTALDTHNNREVIKMSEHDRKHRGNIHIFPRKKQPLIPDIQMKAWDNKLYTDEVPISSAYPAIDNDLARDNIENDIPQADLQDI